MRLSLKQVPILVIPLAITQDVIPRLQVMTAWACNVFRGHMALVVLAHESMTKSDLSHQAIKTPRKLFEVRWGPQRRRPQCSSGIEATRRGCSPVLAPDSNCK